MKQWGGWNCDQEKEGGGRAGMMFVDVVNLKVHLLTRSLRVTHSSKNGCYVFVKLHCFQGSAIVHRQNLQKLLTEIDPQAVEKLNPDVEGKEKKYKACNLQCAYIHCNNCRNFV